MACGTMRRGAMKRRLAVLSAVLFVGACSTNPTPSATQPSPTALSRPPSAVPSAPSAAPTRASPNASPQPSAAGSPVLLDAGFSPAYTGDRVTLTVDATRTGNRGDSPLPVTATVDFGDGSSGTTSSCGAPATVEHVFSRGGHYQPKVTAASICEPLWTPDLSFSSTSLLVFPSAPAASATWPTCSTFQLGLTGRSLGGGMGNEHDLVALQNHSRTACKLDGYPGLRLVDADGLLLPTTVDRQPLNQSPLGSQPRPPFVTHPVALLPGASASFELTYELNPSGPAGNEPYAVACPRSTWIRVTFPGTTQYGTVGLAAGACSGVLYVLPLVPGATGLSF
ncbi:MAG: DUF4232 domain-containing protein [Candidatus Limnocylindrales bacterium]